MAQCPSCDAAGRHVLLLLWPYGPQRYCSVCGRIWADEETERAGEVLDKLFEEYGFADPDAEE